MMRSYPRLLLLSKASFALNVETTYIQNPYRYRFGPNTITSFLTKHISKVLFIPFGENADYWNKYEKRVQKALTDYKVTSIHQFNYGSLEDYAEAVANTEAICVGGGNSAQLIHYLRDLKLFDVIRHRVLKENIPYVGWSAGSYITAPDITVCDDKPIKESLKGLNFVPYNIYPFDEWKPETKPNDYMGETREKYLNRRIITISDGMGILVEAGKHFVLGLSGSEGQIWLPNASPHGYEVQDLSVGQEITPLLHGFSTDDEMF